MILAASGLSYSFFSFAVDVSVSIHHDDAFHALMRCAFAGVISFMISHVFDLEFGPQGDRILFRIAQLLNATFLGGGHILLFMHSKSHLWTHSAIQSLLLESRASLTVLSLCEYLPSSHEELLAASSLECFQDIYGWNLSAPWFLNVIVDYSSRFALPEDLRQAWAHGKLDFVSLPGLWTCPLLFCGLKSLPKNAFVLLQQYFEHFSFMPC